MAELPEGDFVIRDYVFRSGEILPELKLHYGTLGTAQRKPLESLKSISLQRRVACEP
jgi:hypothetical protein